MARRFEYDAITSAAIRESMSRIGIDEAGLTAITGSDPRVVASWLRDERDAPHWLAVVLVLLEGSDALQAARSISHEQLTPVDLRASLAKVNQDAHAFARLTGAAPRTIQRWLSGDAFIPNWVRLFFALLDLPKGAGVARLVAASLIRIDNENPDAGEYPFKTDRQMPADAPSWLI